MIKFKKILSCLFCGLMILEIGCKRESNNIVDYNSFPDIINPKGKVVSINSDSILMIGKVEAIPTGYMVYLYHNENFIGLTDDSFKLTKLTAHKGQGPQEVNGVSGKFGQVIDDNLSIFDPYSFTLFGINPETGNIKKIVDFKKTMAKYNPFNVIQLKNGAYISPRGDNKYGIVCFDPNLKEVKEWPIGLKDIDIDSPEESHISMRAFDYNPKNGVVAEIYGALPSIILHNESGEIIRVLTIEGLPRKIDKNLDYFSDICLTDDYIFLLWGDPSEDSSSLVLVMTYDGKPVSNLKIRPTQTLSLDIPKRSIISTNVNFDDSNVMIYGPLDVL